MIKKTQHEVQVKKNDVSNLAQGARIEVLRYYVVFDFFVVVKFLL